MELNTTKYIAICGGENVGKTTHIKMLQQKFPQDLFVKEPGSYQIERAKLYQKAALDRSYKVGPRERELLFNTSRACQVEQLIIPELKKGRRIISDRSWLDGFMYGTAVEKVDPLPLFHCNEFAVQSVFPTHYIFMKKEGISTREPKKNDLYDDREKEINPKIERTYKFVQQFIAVLNERYSNGETRKRYNFFFHSFTVDMAKSIEENNLALHKLISVIFNANHWYVEIS